MNVPDVIKALQAKDAEAKAETQHHAAQRVARALADGSELLEPSTGAILVRQRTEALVPVPA